MLGGRNRCSRMRLRMSAAARMSARCHCLPKWFRCHAIRREADGVRQCPNLDVVSSKTEWSERTPSVDHNSTSPQLPRPSARANSGCGDTALL
jgi:hypothetical protein